MDVIGCCRLLATFTEEPGYTTRTFLCAPMREVHRQLQSWMERLGMSVRVDAAGNLRGLYAGTEEGRLLIGSHLDTVPRGGAFDGVLGVVLGIALVEALDGRRLPFSIEVIGFSEEEGVRFGIPFLGSRGLAGTFDDALLAKKDARGITVSEAIRAFGLDPLKIPEAAMDTGAFGYLEFHIEQGPVLESLDLQLGVVDAIAGQSRLELQFRGQANHAGTTPMHLRRDALAAAAEWIAFVESEANRTAGMVATVGRIAARPGAGNVIAGEVTASLDVRHAGDDIRRGAVERILAEAQDVAGRRGVKVDWQTNLEHAAVACSADLSDALRRAVAAAGLPVHRMVSGAGHDAMIIASKLPVAMLFLRSPGGVSHHPEEAVRVEDVDAALRTGLQFLSVLEERRD
ncbi:MAG TPA: allantoate amidohydrolase [Bryobacteraceae bacterium]|nr:allantoate amidohydrolase [Bryobacteraceae bacterium]